MLWQFFMDSNYSSPSQPRAFSIRFDWAKMNTVYRVPRFPLSPLHILILILPGVLHCDWKITVRLEEISHNCFEKFCVYFTNRTSGTERIRESRRFTLFSQAPLVKVQRGPSATSGRSPAEVDLYTQNLIGNDILKLFNPWRQRYLLILSMIKNL